MFGEGLLRGMGWQPGMAIGRTNKKEIKPVEYVPRVGRLGLGADPSALLDRDNEADGKKKKRIKKQGETDARKTQMMVAPVSDTVECFWRMLHSPHVSAG